MLWKKYLTVSVAGAALAVPMTGHADFVEFDFTEDFSDVPEGEIESDWGDWNEIRNHENAYVGIEDGDLVLRRDGEHSDGSKSRFGYGGASDDGVPSDTWDNYRITAEFTSSDNSSAPGLFARWDGTTWTGSSTNAYGVGFNNDQELMIGVNPDHTNNAFDEGDDGIILASTHVADREDGDRERLEFSVVGHELSATLYRWNEDEEDFEYVTSLSAEDPDQTYDTGSLGLSTYNVWNFETRFHSIEATGIPEPASLGLLGAGSLLLLGRRRRNM